jgi:hypothetical protein
MDTFPHQEILRDHPTIGQSEKRRVAGFIAPEAKATAAPRPDQAEGTDQKFIWLTVMSLLGLSISYVLAFTFPLLEPWENARSVAAAPLAASSDPASAGVKVQPTFHEQFNLKPTQGDAEERVATF